MRRGLYLKLAHEGILKNKKLYVPYLITCICMIAMFYIVTFLSFGADYSSIRGGDMVQSLLAMGMVVIAFFSILFLFYTNAFLVRKRKKEFGLYNILGLDKHNIAKILLLENLIITVYSLFFGLLFGILFSKLGEMIALKLLGGTPMLTLHITKEPILYTILLFIGIFSLIMLRTLGSIYLLRPVELLKSESVGEKQPKANWLLAIIGLILLGFAYYIAVQIADPTSALLWFLNAVVLVIIATYLLFVSGSVALCKLLQKNKRYYYQTKHFISTAQMTYRMKRNGASLASICILSTMVLVTVSSTMCVYADTEDSLQKRYPNDIAIEFHIPSLQTIDSERVDSYTKPYKQAVEEQMESQKVEMSNVTHYNVYPFAGAQIGDVLHVNYKNMEDKLQTLPGSSEMVIRMVSAITLEDFNKINHSHISLKEDELLLYTGDSKYPKNTFTIEGIGTWKVQKLNEIPNAFYPAFSNVNGGFLLVFQDNTVIDHIMKSYLEINEDSIAEGSIYPSPSTECYQFDVNCSDAFQLKIAEALEDTLIATAESQTVSQVGFIFSSKVSAKTDIISFNGSFLLLGILLGSIFLFGTILIIYYKQISEGYEDQDRFAILQKVGMTEHEIQKTINSQILTVFFAPLILAGIHLAFAFPLIKKILTLMSGIQPKLFLFVTCGCYLVFALVYMIVYWITSKSYYEIVCSRKKN